MAKTTTFRTNWLPWELNRSSSINIKRLNSLEDRAHQMEIHWLIGTAGNYTDISKQLDAAHPQGRTLVLNRYARPWQSGTMVRRMRQFALPTSYDAVWNESYRTKDSQYVRTVTFWVYQCEVIAAAHCHSMPQVIGMHRPIAKWSDPPYRRLARMAERAAYALGWDTCSVTIQSTSDANVISIQNDTSSNPRSYALDEPQEGDSIVRAAPVTRRDPEWVWRTYEERIHQDALLLGEERSNEHRQGLDLSFGLDAEFILYHAERRKIIPASRFFDLAGEIGCDAVRVNGKVMYPIMELRPQPGDYAAALVPTIRKLMRAASISVNNVDRENGSMIACLAGSKPLNRFPIGAHLHVAGKMCTTELIRALDTYLALPCSLLEQRRERSEHRRRAGYGTLGDVRQHPHNGAGGFEYRTLWNFLVDPSLSAELLSAFEIIVRHYWKLPGREAARDPIIAAYNEDSRHVYKELAINRLTELKMFAEDKQQLLLSQLIQRLREEWTWKEHTDVRIAWIHA
ncbi:putative amidoligase domain-containing protein [Paenibacillus agilis]|uniref:PhiEco32-like amidoligase-type 2 protein n=1 Tax=Paenibacillus agilis TaxID=3020863 RepID=A0A559IZE0_9BACL|nr:hypothetical protein [Paenibacillus agilis]TVX92995.1 hypothetical protein FPZ44_07940 [Paenibacillus agilis]